MDAKSGTAGEARLLMEEANFPLEKVNTCCCVAGGGPAGMTETLTVYAYRSLFQTLRLGFGSAIGVVVFVLVMLVAAAYLSVLRRQEATA